MPKYAVAVGRKAGIYDTYDECLQQINKYPGAVFKKFISTQEAQDFLRLKSKPSTSQPPSGLSPPKYLSGTFNRSRKTKKSGQNNQGSTLESRDCESVIREPLMSENVNPPECFAIEKVSPSNPALHSLSKRITAIEDKLNKFIASTNEILGNLQNGFDSILAGKVADSVEAEFNLLEPPLKKLKSDKTVETDSATSTGGFQVRNDGIVIVYTDGACTNNGKNEAKAGIGVWFNHDHPLNVGAPVHGPATNNNGEIQAARIAIQQAHQAKIRKLCVYTDSKFLINCITQWIHKWKKNNWELSSGGKVKNKDELIKLDKAVQDLEFVEWKYVAGHRGILGNEMADQLARKGAEMYKTSAT